MGGRGFLPAEALNASDYSILVTSTVPTVGTVPKPDGAEPFLARFVGSLDARLRLVKYSQQDCRRMLNALGCHPS